MSAAKITLYSFAQWMHLNNDDLFANLSLPEGIDRSTLIDNILLRGGEFEVVYSDPNFMQYAIGSWSRKWFRTMEKWITALNIEYNPLENYDRFEHWEDDSNRDTGSVGGSGNTNKRTHADTDTVTNNNTDTRIHDYVDAVDIDSTINDDIDEDDTKETKVSAFDSSEYQPSQYEEASHDGDNTRTEDTSNITSHSGTITDEHTGDIKTAHTGTITDDYDETHSDNGYEDSKTIHEGRLHGNIGVTTSQQMLESELDIATWNIYEHITDLFLTEFVIPIYT